MSTDSSSLDGTKLKLVPAVTVLSWRSPPLGPIGARGHQAGASTPHQQTKIIKAHIL